MGNGGRHRVCNLFLRDFPVQFLAALGQLRIDALHRLCRKLARRRHLHLGFLFHGADSLHKGVLNGAQIRLIDRHPQTFDLVRGLRHCAQHGRNHRIKLILRGKSGGQLVMHLCFIPLTEDERLSAKEIVGNKKKLTWWQDEFWKHMVGKYPDLERGESASETGRTHIPPRLFKEAVHLNRMKDQIMAILNDSNPFNKKSKAEELETLLDKYVPGVEAMRTRLKKYDKTYKELTAENAELEKELNSASRESIQKKLEIQRKLSELDKLRRTVDSIPDAVIREYTEQKYVHHGRMNQEI